MTGNITIHDAELYDQQRSKSRIVFSLDIHGGRYELTLGEPFGMFLRRLDSDTKEKKETNVDSLLWLIQQNQKRDNWTWDKFRFAWQGFAAGLEAGKQFAIKQAGSD